jgi:hypothetical protein
MRSLHGSPYHTHQFVIEGSPGPSRPGAASEETGSLKRGLYLE